MPCLQERFRSAVAALNQLPELAQQSAAAGTGTCVNPAGPTVAEPAVKRTRQGTAKPVTRPPQVCS
jgi:hypothetical protein